MAAWSDFEDAAVKASATVAEAQFEQAIAASRLAVIVALRRRAREDLDLAVVQAEAAVDGGDLRLDRALVRQEQPRRATLDDGGRDRAAIDIRERLGGEDDARVLLAQRLQPFAQLAGKTFVVEGEPAFIDDQQRWPPVEPALDAVEEIGQHGRRRAGADQALGLERLDAGFAQTFGLGVEQTAVGTAEAIGLQGALQGLRLQQYREPGQRAFRDRARWRARRAPTRGDPSPPA